jgi:hypothetical protein
VVESPHDHPHSSDDGATSTPALTAKTHGGT